MNWLNAVRSIAARTTGPVLINRPSATAWSTSPRSNAAQSRPRGTPGRRRWRCSSRTDARRAVRCTRPARAAHRARNPYFQAPKAAAGRAGTRRERDQRPGPEAAPERPRKLAAALVAEAVTPLAQPAQVIRRIAPALLHVESR